MAITRIELSPVTRISGLLTVEAHMDEGVVKQARMVGTLYRGFELMLPGRKVEDAPYFSQRICGICSLAHGLVSNFAVEMAYQLKVPAQVAKLRNILLGFELIQNHLRHFYLLGLPDYVDSPALPFRPQNGRDYRFNLGETRRLVENYFRAIEVSRLCHESIAIFGGKAPHQHGIVPGGVSVKPRSDLVLKAWANLDLINAFLREELLRDVQLLANRYEDYYQIGIGPGNYLSFGLFRQDPGSNILPAGAYYGGEVHPLDLAAIQVGIERTWFVQDPQTGQVLPAPEKPGGYTWVKAPRYRDMVMEVGPLARMVVAGLCSPQSSTMARIVARAREAIWVGGLLLEWLASLQLAGDWEVRPRDLLVNEMAYGATEVLRGSLLHRLEARDHVIVQYEVITPSEWNFSPRDNQNRGGAVETAVTGIRVARPAQPVEIYRTIRSFDPCISCATHLLNAKHNITRYVVDPGPGD